MFRKIIQSFRNSLRNISTIKSLCLGAEQIANAEGQKQPGAEHFILAALDLPDGTARRAFERIQIDPGSFRVAINQQYQDALRNMGIDLQQGNAISDTTVPMPSGTGLYKTQPSAQTLMQHVTRQLKGSNVPLLLGAHVLIAATHTQYGVAIRAFQSMGVDPIKLTEAATEEVKTTHTA